MSRILLLVNDPETQKFMTAHLRNRHELLSGIAPNSPGINFDLSIIDEIGLASYGQVIKKQRELDNPVFLPVLLVVPEIERDINEIIHGNPVDEIIFTPIRLPELTARIENLLRNRRLSLELKHSDRALEDELARGNITQLDLKRYRLLANYSQDIILVTGEDGKIADANKAAEVAYGKSREELLASTIYDIRAPGQVEPDFNELINPDNHGRRFEILHRRSDGTIFPVEVSSRSVKLDGSRVALNIIRDITDRKKTEAALKDSEERLRLALAGTKQGIYDLNLETGEAITSREYSEMLGYDPSEFHQTTTWWLENVHPDDIVRVEKIFLDIQEGRIPEYLLEYRLRTKDGNWKWVLSLGRVVEWNKEGHPSRMLGTHTDLTAQKNVEEALIESREELSEILESINDAFYALDSEGRFRYVNRKAQEEWHKRSQDLLGKKIWDVFPQTIGTFPYQQLNRALTERVRVDFEVYSEFLKDWVEVTAHPSRKGISVYFRNITKRKQAEAALKNSEERLRLALTAANQGLYDLNLQTGEAITSPEYARLLGYDPADFHETNANWVERLHPDDSARVGQFFIDYIEGRVPEYRVEFRQKTRDGNWKWILSLGRVVERDAQGHPLRMLGTHTDITELKLAQFRIQKLTNIYAALSQTNQAIVRITNRNELFQKICEIAIEFGGMFKAWIGMLGTEGTTVHPLTSSARVTEYLQDVVIPVDSEITENTNPVALVVKTGQYYITRDIFTDPRTSRFKELAQQFGFKAMATFPLRQSGKVIGVISFDSDDVSTFEDELSVRLLDEMALDISFALDNYVTQEERTNALEDLRQSEARFRNIVKEVPFPLILHAEDGEVIQLSRSWTEITGYRPEDIPTIDDWTEKAYGERKQPINEYIDQLYSLDRRVDEGEYLINTSSGDFRIWDFSSAPAGTLPDGRRMIVSMASDITERRRAEESLRKLEARYHLIFDKSPLPLWLYDQETMSILDVNEAACEHYGYNRGEFLQLKIEALFPSVLDVDYPQDMYVDEKLDALLRNKWGQNLKFESKHLRKDRSIIQVEVSIQFFVFEGKPTGLMVVNDLTELRRTEEELQKSQEQFRQSQKMEAIGRLAGGVAHDFNNLLTAIIGYSYMLLDTVPQKNENFSMIEEIAKAGERASSLTRQLLTFSRRQIIQPKILDINEIITNFEKMLRRLIGEDIALELDLAHDLGKIFADTGQMEQIIMNIVVNARDAMQEGGRLTIETANQNFDEDILEPSFSISKGNYIRLSFADTGVGMSPEVVDHIFEPYFTTKEQGKGTGLGLSTVYGIVEQCGGSIKVESKPGVGSIFHLYLPRAVIEINQLEQNLFTPIESGNNETILLVEDEQLVRNLVYNVLNEQGYKVLVAENGREALALANSTQGIDLLLSDIIMPDMNGLEVARRIQEGHPALKVLYMSGYTDKGIIEHRFTDPNFNFLQKPFNPGLLLNKVQEVMGVWRR